MVHATANNADLNGTLPYQNPLVGAYTTNANGILLGNIAFNAGGTLNGQESLDIDQGGIPPFVEGAFGTAWTGIWEETAVGQYRFVLTYVLVRKDLTDPALPGIPTARVKVEASIKLSKDLQHIAGTGKVRFYDVNDLSLTKRNRDFPKFIPLTFEGQRIQF